jgi:molybdopterin synthase catalytic subunit
LAAVAAEARRRWPAVGRLALLHRHGRLEVSDVSVVVVASAPHRDEAFAAGRFCIDELKATAPIWKREAWAGGEDWSACSHPLAEVAGP